MVLRHSSTGPGHMYKRPGPTRRILMIARVKCDKCGADGGFDLGDGEFTIAEAQALVDERSVMECPFGHHVEMVPINYTVIEVIEGSAETNDEWVHRMQEEGNILWTTDELCDAGISIIGFAYGGCTAEYNGKKTVLLFDMPPEGGRYYHMRESEWKALGGEV